jgi:hypothetical protein
MKKVYLSLLALTVASGASAQLTDFAEKAVKTNAAVNQGIHAHTNTSFERGTPIWSDDFSSSAAWTISNTGTPSADWVIGTAGPAGGYAIDPIMSTTAANGFAMFDSDGLGDGTSAQDAIIFAGPVDFSGDPSVSIEFETYYREFQGSAYIIASTDGVNWTQFQPSVLTPGANNATANPELVSANLSSVIGGSATAYFGFQYIGGWDYAWMVDDVAIVATPANEVGLSDTRWASQDGVPYTVFHTSQSGSIETTFWGTVTNNGSSDATNATLAVTATAAGAGAPYAGTGTMTTLAAGQVHMDSTTSTWNIGTAVDSWTVDMEASYVESALDNNPSDNSRQVTFSTDNLQWGRDANDYDYSGGGLWNGAGNAYEMGPEYDVYTDMDVYNIDVAFNGNTADGAIAYGIIYQVDAATGDFVEVYNGSGTLTGEYAINAATDLSSGGANWISIPIDGGPFTMTAGEIYIVCVGHYGGPDDIVLLNGNTTAPDQTVFLLDGTDNTWYFMTSTPSIRVNTMPVSLDEQAKNVTLSQAYPNPTSGLTTIGYSLEEAANVAIQITDVTGKVVTTVNEGTMTAGTHTADVDFSELNAGVYFYTLISGNDRVTRRIVVRK